jgi:hypothetical protein
MFLLDVATAGGRPDGERNWKEVFLFSVKQYNVIEQRNYQKVLSPPSMKLKLFTTIPVKTGCRLWAPPCAMLNL